jgi:hypothetical protein
VSRNATVHPVFQPLLNAIAPLVEHGPLEPETPITTRRRNPAQHAYQLLVELTAVHAPPEGYTEAAQLPPLTNRARAVILRGAPDVLNDFDLEPDEIADIFDHEVDARLWLSAKIEPLLRRELFLSVAAQLEADAEILRQNAADPELRRSDWL